MRVSEPRTPRTAAKLCLHSIASKPIPLLLLASIFLLLYTYFTTFHAPNKFNQINAMSGSTTTLVASNNLPPSTTSFITLPSAADAMNGPSSVEGDSAVPFITSFLASRRPMDRALRSREEYRRRSVRRISNPVRQFSWAELSEERQRDENSHEFAFVEVPPIGTLSSSPPPPKDTLENRMRQRAMKEKEVRDFERQVRQRQKELNAQRQYEYWQQLADQENEKERHRAAVASKSQRSQIRIVTGDSASKPRAKTKSGSSILKLDGAVKSHSTESSIDFQDPKAFVEKEAKPTSTAVKRSRRAPRPPGN